MSTSKATTHWWWGRSASTRLPLTRVLVVGLRGVGVEVAKNLLLACPTLHLTLYDNTVVHVSDLGTNFTLTPDDVGTRRSTATVRRLSQLGARGELQAHTGELNENFLSHFHAAVFTDPSMPRADLVRLSAFCHARRSTRLNPRSNRMESVSAAVGFLLGGTLGVACSVFVDAGPVHGHASLGERLEVHGGGSSGGGDSDGGSDAVMLARLAVWEFQDRTGMLPRLHHEADAARCVALARELSAGAVEVDEVAVRKTALYARAELPGLCAFVGGVLALEVVKMVLDGHGDAAHMEPLHEQWTHVEEFDLVGDEVPADASPQASRYDHQISVFGTAFQQELFAQRWLLAGAGTLGCEFLKGFALMGLGAGSGVVTVADKHQIVRSGLVQPFLFTDKDAGALRSIVASHAVTAINPEFRTRAVDSAAEFGALDGVCYASEDGDMEELVGKCVVHRLPMVSGSGSDGEVMVPFKTGVLRGRRHRLDTLGMERREPKMGLEVLVWARARFAQAFGHVPEAVAALMADGRESFLDLLLENPAEEHLRAVWRLLCAAGAPSYRACIALAVSDFGHDFRSDLRTENPLHAAYLRAAADLYARVLGVQRGDLDLDVPALEEPEDVAVALRELRVEGQVEAVEFTADDGDSLCQEYTNVATELRCAELEVEMPSLLRVEGLLVLPMLAAAVSGLVQMELYKVIKGVESGFRRYRVDWSGLSVQPASAVQRVDSGGVPDGFTEWDLIEVDRGDLTLGELAKIFPDLHHGCTLHKVGGIEVGGPRDGERLSELFKDRCVALDVQATDVSGRVVQVPRMKVRVG